MKKVKYTLLLEQFQDLTEKSCGNRANINTPSKNIHYPGLIRALH